VSLLSECGGGVDAGDPSRRPAERSGSGQTGDESDQAYPKAAGGDRAHHALRRRAQGRPDGDLRGPEDDRKRNDARRARCSEGRRRQDERSRKERVQAMTGGKTPDNAPGRSGGRGVAGAAKERSGLAGRK